MAGPNPSATGIVARGGKGTTATPPGALTRRRTGRSDGAGSSRKAQTMNYYTDDSPGLKISPVVVIGMSLGFIFFVTVLHVIAKLRG